MRPFPFPELVWATDATASEPVTKWHVYACPDFTRDTALAELVATAQQVAEKAAPGCVVPVEAPWLHATVHMIDRAASALGERDINDFALSLAQRSQCNMTRIGSAAHADRATHNSLAPAFGAAEDRRR